MPKAKRLMCQQICLRFLSERPNPFRIWICGRFVTEMCTWTSDVIGHWWKKTNLLQIYIPVRITGVQLLQSVIILVSHVQIGCTVSSLRNFYSSNISSSTCQVQDPVMQGEQFTSSSGGPLILLSTCEIMKKKKIMICFPQMFPSTVT